MSGGTGTGKTTLTNAIPAELVETKPEDRLVILEDTGVSPRSPYTTDPLIRAAATRR